MSIARTLFNRDPDINLSNPLVEDPTFENRSALAIGMLVSDMHRRFTDQDRYIGQLREIIDELRRDFPHGQHHTSCSVTGSNPQTCTRCLAETTMALGQHIINTFRMVRQQMSLMEIASTIIHIRRSVTDMDQQTNLIFEITEEYLSGVETNSGEGESKDYIERIVGVRTR